MTVLRRLVFILLLLLPVPVLAKPVVTDARIGADGNVTRVELQISAGSKFHVFYVPDPDRVVIDLDEVDWRVAAGNKLQGTGLVTALRYGLFKAGTSRVVLDLQQAAIVDKIGPGASGDGERLVIDLRPVSEADFKIAVKGGIPASTKSAETATPVPATVGTKVGSTSTTSAKAAVGDAVSGQAQSSNGQQDTAAPPAATGSVGANDDSGASIASDMTAAKQGLTNKEAAKTTAKTKASASPGKLPGVGSEAGQTVASMAVPGAKDSANDKTGKTKSKPALKPMIVIDAGHGGVDPGALGNGVMEKNITLAVALALKKDLLSTGRYRVTLTRDSDIYIPLRDRFKIARDNGADLFISLHADSHNDPFMRGASVYTLSETASDAEAADLANQENKSDIIAGVDLSKQSGMVTDILIDLAQRDTINQSNTFAVSLVSELKSDTLMLEHSHRSAGFAVLKAPDVPSVLIEMGYVSSQKDEALLSDKQHQSRLARAIRRAIDDFFSGREPIRRS